MIQLKTLTSALILSTFLVGSCAMASQKPGGEGDNDETKRKMGSGQRLGKNIDHETNKGIKKVKKEGKKAKKKIKKSLKKL